MFACAHSKKFSSWPKMYSNVALNCDHCGVAKVSDVVAIGNAPNADERNRVDLRADRALDLIVPEELLVVAERLPVHARAKRPPAAKTGARAEVELLVLRVALVHEVRVLPGVVEQDVAGQRLEQACRAR